jgi:hypothetical protein
VLQFKTVVKPFIHLAALQQYHQDGLNPLLNPEFPDFLENRVPGLQEHTSE